MKTLKYPQPIGITYDILHDLRKVQAKLRRIEKYISAQHRAEKRLRIKESHRQWQQETSMLAKLKS